MAILPMVVMIGLIIYKIIKKLMKWVPSQSVKKFCYPQKCDIESSQQGSNSDRIGDNLELPDRILHSEMYEEETTPSTQDQN